MAPPSAFKPSLRQVSGLFWERGRRLGSLKLCVPCSSGAGRLGAQHFSWAPSCCPLVPELGGQLRPWHTRSRDASEDSELSLGEPPVGTGTPALQRAGWERAARPWAPRPGLAVLSGNEVFTQPSLPAG